MNDLQAGSPTPSHDLARHVLDPAIRFDSHRALIAFGGGSITATRERLMRMLCPLRDLEPKLDGAETSKISKHLRLIGMKVLPTMSADQCGAWLKGMIAGYSDLPPHIVQRATADAIHTAFRFIGEVDPHIRLAAEQFLEQHRRALRRLDAMMEEIRRANDPPQPMIEEAPPEPLTSAELQRMNASSAGRGLIRMGLRNGWITQEQLTQANINGEQHEEG